MIHYKPSPYELMPGSPRDDGVSAAESSRHCERFAAMEASLSQLHRAKRAADESLRRAQDAPEPHTTDNSVFVALWEAHLGDREALFSAMRQFDDTREALRSRAAGSGRGDDPAGPVDRRPAG